MIPNQVSHIGVYAFNGCTSLTSVTFGSSLETLENYAFHDCSALTNINLPSSVLEVGEHVFDGCTALASVTLSDELTEIGKYTFANCSALTTIDLPENLTVIMEGLFDKCIRLNSIVIPESVTEIRYAAFNQCTSLTSITAYPTIPPTIERYTFSGVDKTIPVYVSEASIEQYRTAPYWEEFTNFRAISESTNITQTSAEQHIYPMKDKLCNPNALAIIIYDIQGKIVYSGNDTEISIPMHGIYVIETINGTQKVMF